MHFDRNSMKKYHFILMHLIRRPMVLICFLTYDMNFDHLLRYYLPGFLTVTLPFFSSVFKIFYRENLWECRNTLFLNWISVWRFAHPWIISVTDAVCVQWHSAVGTTLPFSLDVCLCSACTHRTLTVLLHFDELSEFGQWKLL